MRIRLARLQRPFGLPAACRPHAWRPAADFGLPKLRRSGLCEELAKHGVVVGSLPLVRCLAWVGLVPLKLVLPTRAWVGLLLRVTTRAVRSFERQQARFGDRNPELFAHLVEHEVRQRDWARSYLNGAGEETRARAGR